MQKSSPSLCVALDAMEPQQAIDLSNHLGQSVDIVKIGLGLFNRAGLQVVDALVSSGREVFLDLKLHDIPTQVGDAVGAIARLGVHYLTLHTSGGPEMLKAAVEYRNRVYQETQSGNEGPFPRLLGVTVLTSLGPHDLEKIGAKPDVNKVVTKRVVLAAETGIDGIVCSPADLGFLNEIPEASSLIKVTPGIRPADHGKDDQQRTATPRSAVEGGANILVVGRPITRAPDPRASAEAIRAAMGISA